MPIEFANPAGDGEIVAPSGVLAVGKPALLGPDTLACRAEHHFPAQMMRRQSPARSQSAPAGSGLGVNGACSLRRVLSCRVRHLGIRQAVALRTILAALSSTLTPKAR